MTDKADKVHPIIEAMARAISRAMNQHQIDIGFAWEIDYKKLPDGSLDLERDWLECVPEAKAAAKVILSAEPTEAMLDSGVAFALNVTIGGDYRWTDYVRDKHKAMTTALRSEMGIE